MHNRLRLLSAATALLYLGPLLAGLGRFGWTQVPVFVVIFVLWLIILRPQQWPRSLTDWKKSDSLITLAAQTATQALLVLVSFGIGHGIGGVTGFALPLPTYLPAAVSFLSIPLCRLIWDPWKAAQMDRFLDEALTEIEAGAPGTGPGDAVLQMTAEMLKPLAALALSAPVAEVEAHLAALAAHLDHQTLAAALRAGSGPGLQRALMIHASQPVALRALAGSHYPAQALVLAGNDPALVALLATRLRAALRADPGVIGDCPTAETLRALAAATADPEASGAMRNLAQAMDAPLRT